MGKKECEDSNAGGMDSYIGDGCSNECKVETGFRCPVG